MIFKEKHVYGYFPDDDAVDARKTRIRIRLAAAFLGAALIGGSAAAWCVWGSEILENEPAPAVPEM